MELTEEEIDDSIVSLRKRQMSCAAVARELGIPTWRVHQCVRKHGLQGRFKAVKDVKGPIAELAEDVRAMRASIAEDSGETDLRLRRLERVVRQLAEKAGVDASLLG